MDTPKTKKTIFARIGAYFGPKDKEQPKKGSLLAEKQAREEKKALPKEVKALSPVSAHLEHEKKRNWNKINRQARRQGSAAISTLVECISIKKE